MSDLKVLSQDGLDCGENSRWIQPILIRYTCEDGKKMAHIRDPMMAGRSCARNSYVIFSYILYACVTIYKYK